ncbi:hypothetical protein [Phenylobacterium sp.]|uniref:hypothetical protein n=1 Tax=Phenylobacterium sp. TaxID=1871053 RepID=UPI003BABEE95
MEAADDLARLRKAVTLLDGEVMLEGWAADRVSVRERRLGLVLLTNWRIMFVDMKGGFSAIPIAKIDYVEIISPTQIMISTWYDRLHLAFDSRGPSSAVLNLLRQDPNWNAVEADLFGKPDVRSLANGNGPAADEGEMAGALRLCELSSSW